MNLLDRTFDTPAENLACDEALLDWCDAHGSEVLRFWEASAHFVVLGYANRANLEINQAACARHGVPIYRRCSGGGAVLQGPGCLNYTLVLQVSATGPLATIPDTNRFVMGRHRELVQALLTQKTLQGWAAGGVITAEAGSDPSTSCTDEVQVCGHTDLAMGGRKFSGNAQRRKRRALLFHGTFLHDFDLSLVGQYLNAPSRQPPYRQHRAHADFLMNLPVPVARLKDSLRALWLADTSPPVWPAEIVQRLAVERYETQDWNLRW